jgi:dTDP-4-dehydrorhamnose 3,5-epimerase
MKLFEFQWGVKAYELDMHEDERGYFSTFYTKLLDQILDKKWAEENQSFSKKGTIRGFHSQEPKQEKLVRCAHGTIMDVIVDPITMRWFSIYLTKPTQWIHIPENLYHGFAAVSDAVVHYKVTELFNPEKQLTIPFNNETLNVPWSIWIDREFIVSKNDRGEK